MPPTPTDGSFFHSPLLDEIAAAKKDEARINKKHLNGGLADPGNPARASPFGALVPPKRQRLKKSASLPTNLAEEEVPKKVRRPAYQRAFLVGIRDPVNLYNEHVGRRDNLMKKIEEYENDLSFCQRTAEERTRQAAEVRAVVFNYDHHHPDAVVSEAQGQFYPRSLERLKDCGGGKIKKFTRPYDDPYKFREAMCRQKASLR
eukprot:gnl/TRDRNA2_/TRDRNA2_182987_c0_seq1.p1 gnl/TRDRNA2_/TRDRNA2_182987_c0~~gnl/TRDRNA2_/TRDRNA2_182987_c0_seq1.p1  ORF type:complete len:203 (+),score=36.47 gnl/TRDRNA2_/TRDRNA2_182987_c0_seq1:60-668(+)